MLQLWGTVTLRCYTCAFAVTPAQVLNRSQRVGAPQLRGLSANNNARQGWQHSMQIAVTIAANVTGDARKLRRHRRYSSDD